MNDELTDLFEKHYTVFVKKMSRRVPNVADAEDIVMVAFERAMKYWDTYKPEQDIAVWLNTLVNNSYKDWLRTSRLRGMTVEVDEKNGGMYDCVGESNRLSQIIVDDVNMMKTGLKKDVVYRRFFMNLPVKHIAEAMGVGVERVKKTLLRWRQEMKDKYGVVV